MVEWDKKSAHDQWVEYTAFVAVIKDVPPEDFKPLPAGKKGGNICSAFLTTGSCVKGDKCEQHHPVRWPICIDFQKQSGCLKGQDCKFCHEVIGGVAAKVLIAHAQAQAKKRKESKGKGGKDGGKGDGKGGCKSKDRGKSPAPKGNDKGKSKGAGGKDPSHKSTKLCENFHGATPGMCVFGENCWWKH